MLPTLILLRAPCMPQLMCAIVMPLAKGFALQDLNVEALH